MPTDIEWADESWNPIVGCSKISEGCQNCYAEKIAKRFSMPGWDGKASFHMSRIDKPHSWKKPKRVFVNSMGDLFHDSVPFEWLERVWETMKSCQRHTFLVLTKRPSRMEEFLNLPSHPHEPLKNVWLGVTAENQDRWDERVPTLCKCKASVKFVSVEPMLGPIKIGWEQPHWVIAGAETGQGKRPMPYGWYNALYTQCLARGIPFFGKKNSEGEPMKPREFPR